ncbi:MAG: sensor histidine kinase [Nocardioidaceae bacterium]
MGRWPVVGWLRPGHLGTESGRATFRTLHTAALASPALREGLTPESAERAARHLRSLMAAPAIALTGTDRLLAWDGRHQHHADACLGYAERVVRSGATVVQDLACDHRGCPLGQVVVTALTVEERPVGTLQVFASAANAALVRAADEVARWTSGQLDLAELDASRARLMEAEVRALRAQISPHFIYNSLTAIASFVRTDPERARELLTEFADFTRYSFRRHGEFTTLAEELKSIERYLDLEQARFGDRLEVTLRLAPEVLPVTIPVLSLQPLVENAVRHGLQRKTGTGRLTILAEDFDQEAVITVEDDGAGEDPERVRRALAGDPEIDSLGLANVDERLRSTFGDEYGLVIETAPGAGTKVTVRVPKYAPGVHA